MATVYLPYGKTKTVSLHWLACKALLVERVDVSIGTESGTWRLMAHLSDGRKFCELFHSRLALWIWLHRPNLYGTPLTWDLPEGGFRDFTIQQGQRDKFPWRK